MRSPGGSKRRCKERGHDVVIVNAGVSGDTASDGLARVDWSVGDDADAVIVELGANDALRGVDPAITRDALDKLLARLDERGLPVLLAGMRAPPNLGAGLRRRLRPDLPRACREIRRDPLPVLPRRRRGSHRPQPGRRHASQCRRASPSSSSASCPSVEALIAEAAAAVTETGLYAESRAA